VHQKIERRKMQTFLPYSDFTRSARVLDYKRLGKQRIEVKQIYNALTVSGHGWRHHPAVKMWKGYEKALVKYGIEICREWRRRGYRDEQLGWFLLRYSEHKERVKYPPWLGTWKFHKSHQSNLLRKDREYYRKWFSNIPSNLPYEWNKGE